MNELIQMALRLAREGDLPDEQLARLIAERDAETAKCLAKEAREVQNRFYGKKIFVRGLIELSSYCKNDCYYCGIRRSNRLAERYRLDEETILACCKAGYELGFRTFVLQGGEDGWYTDDKICHIVASIRNRYPDCAITLSIGEKSRESYRRYREAGADRYLLRHETATDAHYRMLHPKELSFANRMRCLQDLKELGYQTGCGFMVGAPGQTVEHLVRDLRFLKEFNPQMVGIGPFIPHKETPFAGEKAGSVELTVYLLSIIRLMLPQVLLPATTALGSICRDGREQGILAGANVIMPNLSPEDVRGKYLLYNNKLHTGSDAAENKRLLEKQMLAIGYEVVTARGDYPVRES
ncbi:MAG: [FeFe] hydrogenase H-cluster radical SAM maturase HydE [Lachnospiraceae bacterium]|nr:[FeFe] hydrogenase H-cluster radical SAM maturase HydE [Lachnospiraceae bacterium]